MKKVSITKNFLWNFVRVFTNMLFPLITFPYVSRILLADGVGKVSFAQAVITYFVLLANLGIPLYGIMMVAKVRDNKDRLSKLFQELLLITTISTISTLIIFCIVLFNSERIYSEKELFLILGFIIVFMNFGVEWFYQGIEEYAYITKRTIIFKLISLILLFLLVKEQSDYHKYAFVIMFATCGNGILNFINLRKYIYFKKKFPLEIKKHLKPILIIFSVSLATSIYLNLDTVMLGYLADDRAVGLYAASIKIIKIVLELVLALGSVLIPRLSFYIEKGYIQEFQNVARKSASFILFLGLPSIFGLYILAPEVIYLFGGSDFGEAVPAMRIMLPIILFIGFSNLIGLQIMYPQGKEKLVLISVIFGASFNFVLNMILIPKFQHIGAAVGTLIAELIVMLVQVYLARTLLNFKLIQSNALKYIIAACIMAITLIFIPINGMNLKLLIGVLVGILIYISMLIVLKEELTFYIIKTVKAKLKRINN